MSLERARYPQAVDVHIALGNERIPRIFGRYVLDKTLAALGAFQEHKTVVKALREPRLLRRDLYILVVGNGTADVLAFNVLLCNSDVFHDVLR